MKEGIMSKIIKHELIQYLKSPLLYLAIILIAVSSYCSLSIYLNLDVENIYNNLDENSEIYSPNKEIQDGYIPVSEKEKIKLGLKDMRENLIEGYNEKEEDVNKAIAYIEKNDLTREEINEYIKSKFNIDDVDHYFTEYKNKKATKENLKSYITTSLKKDDFSIFFGRKYVDIMTLDLMFVGIVLLIFLYFSDMKRDMYELMHTKAITATKYVGGKIAAGVLVLSLIVAVITIICGIAMMLTNSLECTMKISDIWINVMIFTLPSIIVLVSLFTFITIVFKNPLPAIPLLIMYIIYSNLGGEDSNGTYGYITRPISLMVRFPEQFFETSVDATLLFNQITILFTSIIAICLSIYIWDRRKLK